MDIKKGYSVKELAYELGASSRTVEGWMQGRKMSAMAAKALKALKPKPKPKP